MNPMVCNIHFKHVILTPDKLTIIRILNHENQFNYLHHMAARIKIIRSVDYLDISDRGEVDFPISRAKLKK